nr:glycerophosphoryl diester phosphodiesterase membrane domain-containing protein [Brevundimonas naejangsanensis]
MSFNATESAFEGFRLARRAPLAILAWAGAYVAFFAVFFIVAGGSLVNIISLAEQVEQNPSPSMSDLTMLGQAYGAMMGLALPLSLLFSAVLAAAVARSVIRPQDKRFGYLRLGRDELRVLGATLLVAVLMFALTMGGALVVGVLAGMAAGTGASWLLIPAVLGGLAIVAVAIWLAVRLSLVVPVTFAEQKIAIKESWTMTKGRFWPLLGMAILAGIMSILVGLLGSIVIAPLNLIFGGLNSLIGAETTNVVALVARFWPALLIWGVVNALLSAAQAAIIYAPFSSAYLGLKGQTRV